MLLNAAVQLRLEEGMRRIGHVGFVRANSGPIGLQAAGSRFVPGGLACCVDTVAARLPVLPRAEVSFASPLLPVGCLVNAVAGCHLFHESLSLARITGIVIICAGLYFVTRS